MDFGGTARQVGHSVLEKEMATHSRMSVGNPDTLDRGTWQAAVHGVIKSQTQLNKNNNNIQSTTQIT